MINYRRLLPTITLAAATLMPISAETPLHYRGELFGNAGNGQFAPYYIMSNNGGIVTQPKTAGLRLSAWKDLDLSKRFSYSFGIDVVENRASSTDFMRYDTVTHAMRPHAVHPDREWLQQIYAEVKYRGVFLSAGKKERKSPLFNDRLGSGDFIQSNNARPLPQVRAGFVDFQDIPFTNGWVQIQGEIAFGKYAHDSWLQEHYNYRNEFINLGAWSHYKRAYFRTKPSQPFSVTVGMQVAGQFGGTAYTYNNGRLVRTDAYDTKIKDFLRMLVPTAGEGGNIGDANYWYGNTLGSWDFAARYRLKSGHELKAYFQWPYEDGSGIGKLNGFDGIWGLEYRNKDDNAIVNGAVVEYIDFTNQSGPIHWAPNDYPGTSLTQQATGSDNYYNNFRYNAYQNYGMSQGSPFIPSLVYNTNGFMWILDNRIRGFHAGVEGRIYSPLSYRALVSYRRSWGSYFAPRTEIAHDTSVMLEGAYTVRQVPGLTVKGQVAIDRGTLLGNNFGAMLSLSYNGLLNIFGK